MKTLFLAFLALTSISANADVPAAPTTHFQELLSYFDQGALPTQSELQGIWSGRCFVPRQPDEPFGMVLIAEQVSPEGGPLFPPPGATSMAIAEANVNGEYERPNRFDILTPNDEVLFQNFIRTTDFPTMLVSATDGSWTSKSLGYLRATRKFRDFFIHKLTVLEVDGTLKAGDVAQVCYFFKRVHD